MGALKRYNTTTSQWEEVTVLGYPDTVDGFHASSTPTANTILPLNSSAKFLASLIDFTSQSTIGSGGYMIIGGLQIVWGSGTTSSTGLAFNFNRSFTGTPYAAFSDVQESTSAANGSFIRGLSSTQITIKTSTADNRTVYWLAIGAPS